MWRWRGRLALSFNIVVGCGLTRRARGEDVANSHGVPVNIDTWFKYADFEEVGFDRGYPAFHVGFSSGIVWGVLLEKLSASFHSTSYAANGPSFRDIAPNATMTFDVAVAHEEALSGGR